MTKGLWGMAPTGVRDAFLSAAALVVEVIASPVTDRWGEPSALAEFTVGGIAGHAYLAARIVDRCLDAPEPEGSRLVDPWESYGGIRVDDEDELDDEVHRGIRSDGEYVARRGPAALAAKFGELLDRLGPRLISEPPDRLVPTSVPGTAMLLDGFLGTRTIEMLVHADDLACSVQLPPVAVPSDAATVATATLLGLARYRHGDLAVLRALTRQERQGSDILRCL